MSRKALLAALALPLMFAQEPTLMRRVEPEYPAIAKQTGARGDVVMAITVAPDGKVSAVKVLSGHPMLQNAAKNAVMQWLYQPEPAETTATVTLNFAPGNSGPGGGNIQQAVLVSRKEPIYPAEARALGIGGQVRVMATIGKDGHVKTARAVAGPEQLREPAVAAVEQWFYKPTRLNGEPVETETQVTLNFMPASPGASGTNAAAPATTTGLETAELIERVEPVHPGGELFNQSGTVVFRAKIGLDGRLNDIRVTDASAEFVSSALDAVKQWVYRPAKMNGSPVEAYTTITLRFTPGR
jgi:TonB family protein